MPSTSSITYRRHRFSPEVISHCVWLYFRFQLSYRDIEELMAVQGVTVSYESIRMWCNKFGQAYARAIRHQQHGELGDRWHLDEVHVRIAGQLQYLWRGVDQDGHVIDVLVQTRRDMGAAMRFLQKLRRKAGKTPRIVVTDKLRSYIKPCRHLLPTAMHVSDKAMNNRAENSHQPTRQRERRMRGFKSFKQAQRFLSIFSQFCNFFPTARHALSAENFRVLLARRLVEWRALVLHSQLT